MVLNELKSKIFWIYLIGLIISTILFSLNLKTIKIIGLLGLIIFQLIYNLKSDSKKFNIIGWIYFILFILYMIIYVSLQVKEIELTIISILILLFGMIIAAITLYFFNLKKSKSTIGIILNYIGFALSIIILFGLLFMIASNQNNYILDYNNQQINNVWEFVGFSTSNFYSTNFGEIPLGSLRILSYIELIFSYIIHIIILGRLINSLK